MNGAERSVGTLLAAPDPVAAMKAMRAARRRRYVARADVMEVLYRVYLGGLVAIFAVYLLAGALHEVPADPGSVDGIRAHAPAVIGLALALLVLAGLRSGARGGPLAIEAAEVRYTLLAPVSRRAALRPAALAQLRIAVIAGAILGVVVGNFVFRRFPGSAVEWIGSLAAFGALVPIAVLGAALLACGRRLHIGVASALGVVLVAWSALDLALGWNSSPATMLGDLATLPLQHGADAALAALGAALALALLAAGLLGIGGLRLEAARRRAELVAEMRFSASVQDLRTVILLRRQLASEHPRREPWLRLRVTASNPVWRRDWQSYLRWPVVRIARVVLIAVAAGALAVGGFDLTPVLFALPGPLLFVAALDLIEPLAQESDHPTRRLLLPFAASGLIRRHLWAPIAAMAVVVAIASVTAAVAGGDPGLALGVGAVVFLPLAAVLICAAAVSATNDPYEFMLVPQLATTASVAPIVVSLIAGFIPLFVAWKVEGGDGARVGGVLGIDFLLVALALVGIGVLAWRFDKREREAL
ncbi:MAG TPA: hypothetical protein VHA76_06125 [Solirubrobacterales bacterium]|nr:hypothetical protein [Solirubrobacterales bacterium]